MLGGMSVRCVRWNECEVCQVERVWGVLGGMSVKCARWN